MRAAARLLRSCGLPRSRRRSLCAFAVPGLRQPDDCARLAHEAAQACEGLVARVVAGASSPTLDVLYGLDEMSETLCRVLDTMELCRNVHPDPAWAEAANSAYVQLAGHMQMLNTEPRLYVAVDALLQEPRLRTSLTSEQLRFAQSMAAEFQHDGVHLSAERRQQLCALHAEAEELALRFGSCAGGGESLRVLQQLLERRQQIAAALGHSSWATYACAHGRMEADPSAVRGALVRLLEGLRPLAAAEQRELFSGTPLGGGASQTRAAEAAEAEAALRPYLELQSCLDGIEGVLQQAFGLRLVHAAAAEGELWHPTVRKLLLVRGTAPAGGAAGGEAVGGEAVGVLYLDLFAREGKSGQAALYTLRAAASRPPSRVAAAATAATTTAAAAAASAVAASAVLQRTLPAAALVCDLPRAGAEGSDARTGRATLSAAQLQTLYHEVGHALHALLSRTEFQHLAGVVRATDGSNRCTSRPQAGLLLTRVSLALDSARRSTLWRRPRCSWSTSRATLACCAAGPRMRTRASRCRRRWPHASAPRASSLSRASGRPRRCARCSTSISTPTCATRRPSAAPRSCASSPRGISASRSPPRPPPAGSPALATWRATAPATTPICGLARSAGASGASASRRTLCGARGARAGATACCDTAARASRGRCCANCWRPRPPLARARRLWRTRRRPRCWTSSRCTRRRAALVSREDIYI
jgi:hypothetical protein